MIIVSLAWQSAHFFWALYYAESSYTRRMFAIGLYFVLANLIINIINRDLSDKYETIALTTEIRRKKFKKKTGKLGRLCVAISYAKH